MNNWQEIKLGDHIDIKHGFAFKGEGITKEPTNNILVTPGNFYIGGGFKSDKFKYFDGEYPADYVLKKDDLVVTMTDLSKEGDTLGYAARIPELNGKIFLHNQRIGLVKFISNDIDSDFLYWLMRTKEYQGYVLGSSTGTSIRHTSPKYIKEYCVQVPSIAEQKSIASILSSLDDKIDLLHRQNKTLEALAETLFRQWFVEEVSDDWEEKILSDIADIGIGRTPPRKESHWFSNNESDVKWLSIKDLGAQGVFLFKTQEFLTIEAIKKFSIPVIPKNTVVLSFKMTVGRVGITSEEMLSNEAIAHFKLKDDNFLCIEFVYLFLKNFKYDSLGSTSSIVTSINSSMIKEIRIALPPRKLMEKFKVQASGIFEKIKDNQLQIQKLETLRDTLLPKLISGEIIL